MATRISASHSPFNKHEDQAATAALYVHKHQKMDGNRFLDEEHKLSSAGAASSLKYASPKDLPSFPSTGLRKDDSAAGAAASLGWANQKPFEHWKPDPSASASKAALLAKDYKAPPLWQPEQSTNGAKAAILASKEGGKVEIWRPEASAWGNTAANQAFKTDRNGGLSPKIDYGYTVLGRQGSLMAATGAMSGNRKRSESTPISKPTYPDEANATANALSAATHANDPARKSRNDFPAKSGASPFTNMPKEMFTSHPPVTPEIDERRRSDILHASAVAMAKQMYSMQQKQIDQAAKGQHSNGQSAAISAQGKQKSDSVTSDGTPPMRFNSLQEAAQKLAQERLAKLHDEHAQNREYRSYYGDNPQPTSKLSIRGRARRRASSDGTLDEDREQSQKIRAQMSLFSSTLSQVDAKKRQKDREALMAVAQRNVTASLNGMDQRVFKDTGKIESSMLNEWEVKAHAAAQKNSESRMETYGKVNIGGGKFIDQSIIDAAAARNVQPVLDEINEKAEKERVRQAELKLEQEANKRSADAQKAREKEIREINRKLKEQDKEAERARKEGEKVAKAGLKRAAKQDKRNDKEASLFQKVVEPESIAQTASEPGSTPAVKADQQNSAKNDIGQTESTLETVKAEVKIPAKPRELPDTQEQRDSVTYAAASSIEIAGLRTSMELQTEERLDEIIAEEQHEKSQSSPRSPRGVKGWLKSKFAQRQSKSQKDDSKDTSKDTAVAGSVVVTDDKTQLTETAEGAEMSEVGTSSAQEAPVTQEPMIEEDSGEVSGEERAGRSKRRASSVSSLSTPVAGNDIGQMSSRDEEFEEAKDHFDEQLASAPTFAAAKSGSPARDSRFHEEM